MGYGTKLPEPALVPKGIRQVLYGLRGRVIVNRMMSPRAQTTLYPRDSFRHPPRALLPPSSTTDYTFSSMTLVSQPLSTLEWCFPTITNKYEARRAGRKRGHDAECEGEQLEHMDLRGPTKKPKVADSPGSVSNVSNASNNMALEAMAPHEPLAGADDWRYEPRMPDSVQNEFPLEEEPEPIDVEKVIAILLQALNPPSTKPDPPMRSCRPYPTSPLSNSPDRVPFVRKSVGGPCPGKPDLSLQKWVLSKNHYEE